MVCHRRSGGRTRRLFDPPLRWLSAPAAVPPPAGGTFDRALSVRPMIAALRPSAALRQPHPRLGYRSEHAVQSAYSDHAEVLLLS